MKLSIEFYSRDTETVAKELLGKILVHKTKEGTCKGKIVETEAYLGLNDPGSMGCRKVKNIPKVLLGPQGHAFVYFTYGNHWMFNIIATERIGFPGAVLIRALEPLEGIEIMQKRRGIKEVKELTNGPGKLTEALDINKRHNGLDLTGNVIFLENADEKFDIVKAKRIGISKGKSKLLRFYIKENTFVSSGR